MCRIDRAEEAGASGSGWPRSNACCCAQSNGSRNTGTLPATFGSRPANPARPAILTCAAPWMWSRKEISDDDSTPHAAHSSAFGLMSLTLLRRGFLLLCLLGDASTVVLSIAETRARLGCAEHLVESIHENARALGVHKTAKRSRTPRSVAIKKWTHETRWSRTATWCRCTDSAGRECSVECSVECDLQHFSVLLDDTCLGWQH